MNDIAFIAVISIVFTILLHFNFKKLQVKKAFSRILIITIIYASIPVFMRIFAFLNGKNDPLSIMLSPLLYLISLKLIDTIFLLLFKRNVIFYTAGEKLTEIEKSQRTFFEKLISPLVILIPILLTILIGKETNSFVVVNSLEKNIYVSHSYNEQVMKIEPETKCFFYEALGFKRKVNANDGFSLTFHKKNGKNYEEIKSVFVNFNYLDSNDWEIDID